MRIVWSPDAQSDLIDIYRYYAELNPAAAVTLLGKIHKSAEALLEFPSLGKQNTLKTCRLLQVPHTHYLLPYRARTDAIEILAVFNLRRERPDQFQ